MATAFPGSVSSRAHHGHPAWHHVPRTPSHRVMLFLSRLRIRRSITPRPIPTRPAKQASRASFRRSARRVPGVNPGSSSHKREIPDNGFSSFPDKQLRDLLSASKRHCAKLTKRVRRDGPRERSGSLRGASPAPVVMVAVDPTSFRTLNLGPHREGIHNPARHPQKRYEELELSMYPLRIEPIYACRCWGGRRLAGFLTVPLPAGPVGEAWILSDRGPRPSSCRKAAQLPSLLGLRVPV